MGQKFSTAFDNETFRTGYDGNASEIRVIAFALKLEEEKRWIAILPNALEVENVTENMELCLKL